ncbi:MAG: FAD-dependent monooxygenase [Spirochaetales bacterium]|nr:FAD-dependent monooxygenase [Spirochaetales bacterium]
MKQYDFLIVGGGPAGSTLARLIGKKYKVALLEQESEEGNEKVCGGLIAPDAQKILGSFGLSLPGEVLVSPQMFYVESKDLQKANKARYQRHYLNVDRKRFDNWLLSQIPSSVDLYRPGRYINHVEEENHILVTAELPEGRITLKASCLIGADGGQSRVRRKSVGDFKKLTRYVALQSRVSQTTLPRGYGAFFDSSLSDFYGWTIPKEEELLIGIALNKGPIKEKYERFLHKVLGDNFEEIERKSCTIIRPRKRQDLRCHKGKRILFLGEAAGFISPSSAEGFSYAFRSAQLLSEAILHGGDTIKNYRRKVKRIALQLFLKRQKSRIMYNDILRNFIFRTKWGAI